MSARGRALWPAAAALLVAAFLALAIRHVHGQDATYDEHFYFGAGRTILAGGGWDGVVLLHPPLAYYVSSLPLLVTGAEASSQAAGLLLAARICSLLAFGVPLLVAVLLWARALYGRAAALLALALTAFSPTVLAHAPLITPDMALTATTCWALFLYWRSERGGAVWPWAAALGLCLLTKVSALLVAGAIVLLALPRVRRQGARVVARQLALGLAGAWLVLNAGYGFAGLLDWRAKRELIARVPPHPVLRAAAWTAAPFFPVPYLRSVGRQSHVGLDGRPSYLLGEISHSGWRHYYLVALAVKETVPSLLLLLAAFASLLWARPRAPDEPALLLPAFLVIAAFSLGAVQIGIRYVLPALPLLFVFASRLAGPGRFPRLPARAATAVIAVSAAAHAGATLRGGPDYLAYFNELVGGPANGYRYLGDSNLDWGQNRSRAEAYARAQGAHFEPLLLPARGRVVLSTNRIQGFMDPPRYRLLRDEHLPVDRVGHNWLVYDVGRNRRFPEEAMVPVLSGTHWRTAKAGHGAALPALPAAEGAQAVAATAPAFEEQDAFPGTAARLIGCAPGLPDCVLAHEFTLGAAPAHAVAYYATGGDYVLTVNGRVAAAGGRCRPRLLREQKRLVEHLRAGRNVVAVRTAACGSLAPVLFFEMRVAEAR